MYWHDWVASLKDLLVLEGSPVAVTYSHTGTEEVPSRNGRVSVCQAIRRAAEGETVDLTAEKSGCPGGLVSLGLGEMPSGSSERLTDFLVNKEKVYCSPVALYRGQQTVKKPLGLARHVIFAPLDRASMQPDLVIFCCNPMQAQQVLALCNYWHGGSLLAELAGPACRNAIAYPLVTGQVGASLLDFGARRLGGYRADQMLVSVPLPQMHLAMLAEERGAGRMKQVEVAELEKRIEEFSQDLGADSAG